MGILSIINRNLLHSPKSKLKSLSSSSNSSWLSASFSSSPLPIPVAGAFGKNHVSAPMVGGVSMNNNLMLLIQHINKGPGNNIYTSADMAVWLDHFSLNRLYNYSLISAENSWTDHHSLPSNPFFSGQAIKYRLGRSCNELLSLYYENNDTSGEALWNPTTNEFKPLPESCLTPPDAVAKNIIGFGLGFEPKSLDYKAIRFLVFDYKDGTDSYGENDHIEMYSLKTHSWKRIKCVPRCPIPYESPYVHVNGVCYWLAMSGSCIISFNFADEKFAPHIPPPPPFDKEVPGGGMGDIGDDVNYILVDFEGSLAALVHSKLSTTRKQQKQPFNFEVLVWNGVLWTPRVPKITIDVPGGVASVVGLFQNDKLFLQGFEDGELMLFDLAESKLEYLGIHADPNDVEIFPYVGGAPFYSLPMGNK